MKKTYKDLIVEKIGVMESGSIFIANDFLDIANYERVRNILNRLVGDNEIRRIMKGIYYQPRFNKLMNEYEAPNIHEVALAIARKYNWTIVPSGNAALNALGLSTQVPAKWYYISDGRYITYSFEGIDIIFKRRSNAEISKISTTTAMLIQAIKTIGKDCVTEQQIRSLRKKLSADEKEKLLKEGKAARSWIYEVLRKIGDDLGEK